MVERAGELAQEPGACATDQFNNLCTIAGHRDPARSRSLGAEPRRGARVLPRHRHRELADGCLRRAQGAQPRGADRRPRAGRLGGDQRRRRKWVVAMQGWTGIEPPHWDAAHVDDLWTITDDEALAMRRRLAREEGIFAGTSSGANVVGALRLAEQLPPGSIVVTLAVDSGFKYLAGPPYVDAWTQ
ncbi:MAG TPA: pyridoxal-phosphate dependent enzyme [Gaiellaceae bacterium]|nr:pyridoxal-phosphate dependent enzyme [Gaiellaceae bacterium]